MAKILLVEDHADTSDVLALFLRRCGHTVDCSVDGREALAQIISHKPDIVVLDLNLPEMNGAELLDTLRSYVRLHALPVVVCTACPEGAVAHQARALHVSAMLTKGKSTLQELSVAIEQALAKSAGSAIIPPEKWRNDEISPL